MQAYYNGFELDGFNFNLKQHTYMSHAIYTICLYSVQIRFVIAKENI